MRKKSIVGFVVVVVGLLLVLATFWLRGAQDVVPLISTLPEDGVAQPTTVSLPDTPEVEERAEVLPAAVSTPEPEQPRTLGAGTLHAMVTDRVGVPAANARIRLEIRKGYAGEADGFPVMGTAGSDGEAHFTELPWGYYMVSAELNGQIGWASAVLGGGRPKASSVTIVLKPSGGITGRVLNTRREGIPNATVAALEFLNSYGDVLQRVSSDGKGEFSFAGLPIGQYRLEAAAAGYATTLSENVAIDGAPVTVVLTKGGRLSGVTLWASDRSPVSGVSIQVIAEDYQDGKFSVSSDIQGKFLVENLPLGFMRLTSEDSRYAFVPSQSTFDMTIRGMTNVELLVEDAARVEGQVFDPSKGQPVAGVFIAARNLSGRGRNWLSEPTDAEGHYVLTGLSPGELRVQFGRVPVPYTRGLNEGAQEIELQPGESYVGLDFALPSGLMVCGVVVDEQGEPVAGAMVSQGTIYAREGKPLQYHHTVSDGAGAFCFANVSRGHVELEATYRGSRSAVLLLKDVAESVMEVSLKLLPRALGVIAGRVVDERSRPAVASLRLSQPTSGNFFDSRLERSDADGHFLFQDLAAGDFEIWMAPDNGTGYNAGKKMALALTLSAGQRVTDLRLVMSEGGVITGTVIDESGSPVEGANIEAWDEFDENVSAAFTDRQGNFRITNLEGDQFELRPRDDVPGGYWSVPAKPGDHVEIVISSGPTEQRQTLGQGQVPAP